MIFIGIDPGLSGAVAALDGSRLLWVIDTPSVQHRQKVRRERRYRDKATKKLVRTGEKVSRIKTAREPDPAGMADILRVFEGREVQVALEKVGSRPREAPSSAFKFGTGYGVWLGILGAFRFQRTDLRPQQWQQVIFGEKGTGDAGDTKKRSILRAGQLFPDAVGTIKSHDGRSDAILIAEALRRLSEG